MSYDSHAHALLHGLHLYATAPGWNEREKTSDLIWDLAYGLMDSGEQDQILDAIKTMGETCNPENSVEHGYTEDEVDALHELCGVLFATTKASLEADA